MRSDVRASRARTSSCSRTAGLRAHNVVAVRQVLPEPQLCAAVVRICVSPVCEARH